uniref:Uncharacterized protein n=2 Tax=Lotharella globosa TaxID=91324 RepID=A0A7S3YWH5_9EUKA|mmetsp:Transcript_27740/g.53993  ORF Transcript_27740/g.53993 Transcript_27740/m.53993 type:complete len:117 (+) Transcript_27740:933-1283(+)
METCRGAKRVRRRLADFLSSPTYVDTSLPQPLGTPSVPIHAEVKIPCIPKDMESLVDKLPPSWSVQLDCLDNAHIRASARGCLHDEERDGKPREERLSQMETISCEQLLNLVSTRR